MTSKKRTRAAGKSEIEEIVGTGKEFTVTEVPTWRDIYRYGLFLREDFATKNELTVSKYSLNTLGNDVAAAVFRQWKKASKDFIPPVTIREKTLKDKIIRKWNKLNSIVNRTKKINQYSDECINELDTLCDICVCRCKITLCGQDGNDCDGCSQKAHIICNCPKEIKVPKLELFWLYHQRIKTSEISKVQMSGIDTSEQGREERRQARAEVQHRYEPQENREVVNPSEEPMDIEILFELVLVKFEKVLLNSKR